MSLDQVTLLFVEDDERTMDAMEALLTGEVKELYPAKDGQEGLELFKAHHPDIVLTDIEMPRMNGLAMVEEIRSIDPRQPIGIVTAYADREHLEQAVNLGVNKYVYKPVHAAQLFETLEKLKEISDKTHRVQETLSPDIETLHERVSQLEAALESTNTGFFYWNTVTDNLMRGVVFDKHLQFEEATAPQSFTEWTETWHPDDRPVVLNDLQSYVHERRTESIHRRLRTQKADGEWISILLQAKSHMDEKGVYHVAGVVTDITEQSKQEQKVFDQSNYDTATNLPSYALFEEQVRSKIRDHDSTGSRFTLCFVHLNGMEEIEESKGSECADHITVSVADRLNALCCGELLGRVGKNTFGLTLSDKMTRSELSLFLKETISIVTGAIECENDAVPITANIGVSTYAKRSVVGAEELIHQAIMAMHEAMINKANTYHFFSRSASDELKQTTVLLERFDNAIDNDELRLLYQPKIHMPTGDLVGVEALVRWQDPEKGLLAPHAFLPIAEKEEAVMNKLGRWVFTTAFEQILSWRNVGLDLSVSINVGASEFENGEILKRVTALFDTYPTIHPSVVEIEVLETQAVKKIDEFSAQLQSCRDMGLRIAIDDFGTGYASLNYLKSFPWDTLKIDRSFVKDIADDFRSSSIVELSVKLANSFDSVVVAEGVEDENCGLALLHYGCVLAQGYAIAKPLAPEAFVDWKQTWEPFMSWQSSGVARH